MKVEARHVRDFKPGDRVRHASWGEVGTVEKVDDRVHVRFDKPASRGAVTRGEYDELWFSIHPYGLQILAREAGA
jgi:hypothetical protein